MKKSIKLYYTHKGKNFGDVISYHIFKKLFSCEIKPTRPYTADYMAIGSILDRLLYQSRRISRQNIKRFYYSVLLRNRPIHILGSGFIDDVRKSYKSLKLFRPIQIAALRGHLTREIIEEITARNLDDIALGDPGLLISDLLSEIPEQKTYTVGIIPHVVDKDSGILDTLRTIPGVCILDIEEEPIRLLEQIVQCETIASSSLHGLITADSLHIPNLWIRFSDNLKGGDFKFLDYYSIYGMSPSCTDLRKADISTISADKIHKNYAVPTETVEAAKQRLKNTLKDALSR